MREYFEVTFYGKAPFVTQSLEEICYNYGMDYDESLSILRGSVQDPLELLKGHPISREEYERRRGECLRGYT